MSAPCRHSQEGKSKSSQSYTGGGFYENVPRMLPDGIRAKIDTHSFPGLPIFDIIQRAGNISTRDMFNTFNMGIGLIMAVDAADAGKAMYTLAEMGEHPYLIGTCEEGDTAVELW